MKSKSLFVFAMLSLSALAFAADKNSASVQIAKPVTVAGTQIAPGNYKLVWEGNGPDVTVTFLNGKKTVATAPAKLVNTASGQEKAVETFTAADKTQLLKAVDLKNMSLQFQLPVSVAGN
jgi:hypothetical protein